MRAKYLLQVHPLVFSEDLPSLSKELQSDFEKLFKPILQLSPNDGGILNCHKLKGKLKGYHSLEITYNNQEYRLVYRIYDKPIPKRVKIISFDVHDPAYEKAQQRVL